MTSDTNWKKSSTSLLNPRALMEFELGFAIAGMVTIAAILIDWPRALVGLVFGAISHYLPYGTIVVPVGSAVIAAAAEFVYPIIGRTTEPNLNSFIIGFFQSRQRRPASTLRCAT